MELKPTSVVQVSIARKEDIKRKQQDELCKRKGNIEREEYERKIRNQEDNKLVHNASKVENIRVLSLESDGSQQSGEKNKLLSDNLKDLDSSNKEELKAVCFQDPDLGCRIDISS